MNMKLGGIALLMFVLLPLGVLGEEPAPRADGIYVTATTSQGGTVDVALETSGSPMERSRSKSGLVRQFALGSPLALLAQGSRGEVVELVIDVVRNGKEAGHVSARGDRVTGSVLQDQPRVSAF